MEVPDFFCFLYLRLAIKLITGIIPDVSIHNNDLKTGIIIISIIGTLLSSYIVLLIIFPITSSLWNSMASATKNMVGAKQREQRDHHANVHAYAWISADLSPKKIEKTIPIVKRVREKVRRRFSALGFLFSIVVSFMSFLSIGIPSLFARSDGLSIGDSIDVFEFFNASISRCNRLFSSESAFVTSAFCWAVVFAVANSVLIKSVSYVVSLSSNS